MLKLQFKDRRRESVWLVDSRFTIGKANSNSLVLDDSAVDDVHVEIINQQDQLFLKKRTPKGSVKVNGLEIQDSSPLKANDTIQIGSVVLELIDSQSLGTQSARQQPWSLHSNASWLEKQDYVINKKTLIGRDPSCDICLMLDYLSRKHISLEPLNGKLFIEDLNSSNGTFVNGERVQKAELKPGDKIKLDVLTFEVRGPSGQAINDPHKTIIRSIPNPQAEVNKTASGQASPVSPETLKSTPAKSGTSRPTARQTPRPNAESAESKEKAIARKRLAAEGKQAWISGDNQLKPKPDKKKSNRGTYIVIAILVIVGAGVLYTLNI